MLKKLFFVLVVLGFVGALQAQKYSFNDIDILGACTGSGCATGEIASGTSALGTAEIASGACATAVTTSATGTATTDVIKVGFNGDPTGITGYTPSAMLSIVAYPTANNVNFKVCNTSASPITPGAITLNWRVDR